MKKITRYKIDDEPDEMDIIWRYAKLFFRSESGVNVRDVGRRLPHFPLFPLKCKRCSGPQQGQTVKEAVRKRHRVTAITEVAEIVNSNQINTTL